MTRTFTIATAPALTLRDGFTVANNYEQYLDIERSIFAFRREGDTAEYDEDTYIIQRITFVRPDSNTHGNTYESAYITHFMNVPSGDHQDTDHQINVTVEEAIRLCFNSTTTGE